jgi:UDP-N-acetylmuramyl pentapeptide phosphotransferase/UDP-N-acetylglucosamine-1-phosphate transferase
MSRRRSHWGTVVAGGVVIVAGFGIAAVEALKLPRGSIWIVVAAALVLVLLIRRATR